MPKIIYLGVHPPSHKNIGDFAQVLGIRKWFQDYFPSWEVSEFDKSAVMHHLEEITKDIKQDDLIFIHSGGDMGDRYHVWEQARHAIVKALPKNKIVSLPQTIRFSKLRNLEAAANVYNAHPDLTIMARDEVSFQTALTHFNQSRVLLVPDFALYLRPPIYDGPRSGVLVCLRRDQEARLGSKEREELSKLGTLYDTSRSLGITPEMRQARFEETMAEFQRCEAVITDRFHGMIFAHMTQTPCLVLSTRGHKVTSGLEWFGNQIQLISNLSLVLDALRNLSPPKPIDWSKHFIPLKSRLFHGLRLDYRDEFQLIKHRRSIRKWKHYPVEKNELRLVLEAGALAPSGANDQRLRLLPLQDPGLIKQICEIKEDWTTANNPEVIVLSLFDLAAKGRLNNRRLEGHWSRLFWQDTAAAMENMMLMAESLGLSTCWVSLVLKDREARVRKLLQINKRYLIACALFLGYGDQKRDYETAMWLKRPLKRDLNKIILELDAPTS